MSLFVYLSFKQKRRMGDNVINFGCTESAIENMRETTSSLIPSCFGR